MVVILVLALLACVFADINSNISQSQSKHPSWVINLPPQFSNFSQDNSFNIKGNSSDLRTFEFIAEHFLVSTDSYTDGEVVDALEHYFWGKKKGLALELGSLDGSPKTRSMTTEYERLLGWKRILIEGDPRYRKDMKKNSPLSFGVNAAICEKHTNVHFKPVDYVGGIIEFMSEPFLKRFHKDIYNAGVPHGNISSIDWSKFGHGVLTIECMPLSHILHWIHVHHINYFILDVEGGEFEVLKSINWNITTFDVLCIETKPSSRPPGFRENIVNYLSARGYVDSSGQQGRNTWFIRKNFIPSARPGTDPKCFNGMRKAEREEAYLLNKNTPPFKKCAKI